MNYSEHAKEIRERKIQLTKKVDHLTEEINTFTNKLKDTKYDVIEGYRAMLKLKEMRQVRRVAKTELCKVECMDRALYQLEKQDESLDEYHDTWIIDREKEKEKLLSSIL